MHFVTFLLWACISFQFEFHVTVAHRNTLNTQYMSRKSVLMTKVSVQIPNYEQKIAANTPKNFANNHNMSTTLVSRTKANSVAMTKILIIVSDQSFCAQWPKNWCTMMKKWNSSTMMKISGVFTESFLHVLHQILIHQLPTWLLNDLLPSTLSLI